MNNLEQLETFPKYALKVQNNETPFKVIKFGYYEIRLYWSKRGTYGHQVITTMFGKNGICYANRTSSCGYCKESHSMELVWKAIGAHPVKNAYLHSDISNDYYVGGNFFDVPDSEIVEIDEVA